MCMYYFFFIIIVNGPVVCTVSVYICISRGTVDVFNS